VVALAIRTQQVTKESILSQRVADEAANRRGLVLGLTLAELLLLLLFLLLLAMTWKMSLFQKEADAERNKAASLALKLEGFQVTLGSLAPVLAELNKSGGLSVPSVQDLVATLNSARELKTEVTDLRRSKSELMAEYMALKATVVDSAKLGKFNEAIIAAAEVDPNDPPAALVRAIEVLKKIGSDTKPEDVKSLSEMSAANADLRNVMTSLEGDRDKYKRQVSNLVRGGNGLTYPSCWTKPEGQTEYMFDITILDAGLILKDATIVLDAVG
jgi:hypothetical protein